MRAFIIGAAILLTVPTGASAAPTLTMREARTAVRTVSRSMAQPWTENAARIGVRCSRVNTLRARCNVHVRGDRINVHYTASVLATKDSYIVRFR